MSLVDWQDLLSYRENIIAGIAVVDVWDTTDVHQATDGKLTNEQAMYILALLIKEHNANIGINIEQIQYLAETTFRRNNEHPNEHTPIKNTTHKT
jgi:hypothetical protein